MFDTNLEAIFIHRISQYWPLDTHDFKENFRRRFRANDVAIGRLALQATHFPYARQIIPIIALDLDREGNAN